MRHPWVPGRWCCVLHHDGEHTGQRLWGEGRGEEQRRGIDVQVSRDIWEEGASGTQMYASGTSKCELRSNIFATSH